MRLPRSTFYDASPAPLDADAVLVRIGAICDEFECYGYRRVGAALRQQGVVVNGKKLRRLMRENGLQPKRRRRYVVTTDSDHAGPIYPDLAKDVLPDHPNQLWVADLTYVAIPGGFVYLAAILDAWSRKVVGYAISRSMDARIAVAALKAAIRNRAPPKGCIHHSDRGSQYASEVYRELLAVCDVAENCWKSARSQSCCHLLSSRELGLQWVCIHVDIEPRFGGLWRQNYRPLSNVGISWLEIPDIAAISGI